MGTNTQMKVSAAKTSEPFILKIENITPAIIACMRETIM
jgi:hypothetical protein